ncbi:MAG: hypothetical protein IIA62_05775, partial [Nitrospinae bacterium]|nr:hypothetical protein [Nitrospinota bacterium]
ILSSFITAFFLLLASLTRYDAWLAIPFFIWIWLKQKRVTIPQFFVSFAIVMAGPMIWIWRQQKVFGSWHLFLDHYLSGGGASSASKTGDPLLNGLTVITDSGSVTMGISWYVFYFGLKKIVSSCRGEPVKGPSPAIHLKNFGVVYGFFAFYVLGMALVAVLGLFPAWIRYHVGYLPMVFVIFSIVYAEKILPALRKPRGLIFSKKQISAGLVVLHLIFVSILLTPKHNRSLIEAGKVLAGSYEGGMILSDLPAFIYGTGLPVESFISSNDIPDDPSLWGDYLKSRNVKYLVWTSADYAKISYFEEGLLKNNKTGVKFAHIYSTDPNPVRKCHVYKVVDYGI